VVGVIHMTVPVDATGFPRICYSCFFITMTSKCAQPTSNKAVLFAGPDGVFTNSLAQSSHKLWPIIISYAKILARVRTQSMFSSLISF